MIFLLSLGFLFIIAGIFCGFCVNMFLFFLLFSLGGICFLISQSLWERHVNKQNILQITHDVLKLRVYRIEKELGFLDNSDSEDFLQD